MPFGSHCMSLYRNVMLSNEEREKNVIVYALSVMPTEKKKRTKTKQNKMVEKETSNAIKYKRNAW